MGRTSSPFTLIRCPACGTPRTVSARQARRKPKSCSSCREEPDDLRGFWLENFDDNDICLMAESVAGLPLGTVDRALVASARSGIVTAP